MPSSRFQPFITPKDTFPEKAEPVKSKFGQSAYDGNPTILNAEWVRSVMEKGTNANSIQNAVLEFVPARGLGTLVSRLSISIRVGGKVFVKPECAGINALLIHYGFKQLAEDNKEGFLVFQK